MKQEINLSKEHAEFLTVTCLEWKHVLKEDRFKDIITESLTYLAESNRVYVYAFVIMSNHFHLIWQMMGEHKKSQCAARLFEIHKPTDFESNESRKIETAERAIGQRKRQELPSVGTELVGCAVVET
jgi:REP element-mobilizing transposase RayT